MQRPVWTLGRVICAIVWVACDSADVAPIDSACGDAAGGDSADELTPIESKACTPGDAGLGTVYSTDASDACPARWSDLADGGYPGVCAENGLVCIYPEGQAVCAWDGPILKWWQFGGGPGCPEYPPSQCQACFIPFGNVCQYVTGLPRTTLPATFCCDGNTGLWDLTTTSGCSNGNVCGTILASDYDQTCTTASDCALVIEGNLCAMGCNNCANAAVSVAALGQYDVDFRRKLSIPRICPCPLGPSVVCNSGKCGTGQ